MVSVRCISEAMPGPNSMTMKREPFSGGAVPRMRAPMSSTPSPMPMSTGIRSEHHIKVEATPSRGCLVLVAGPSTMTLATFLLSWPVTTRRIGFAWAMGYSFCCLFLVLLILRRERSEPRRMQAEAPEGRALRGSALTRRAPQGEDLGCRCCRRRCRRRGALQIDELDDVAVGIADIGAAADEHAGLAVLFLEDFDALFGQALDRVVVGLRRDLERGVDLVAAAGVERDRVLRIGQIEKIAAGAQEHDALGAADFLEAEQLGVEFFGAVEILYRNGEVQNAVGLDHACPYAARAQAGAGP